jgi:uncharacterized protein with NAD-binding domain and iron-sulfur cluster
MADTAKTRVAVLGGGCGALAAAFWLTATPELRERYSVTVYTRGWRLGGKGASGRNSAKADRIEEHGIHIWMGVYTNAFRTFRECFGEWVRPPNHPFKNWEDAFKPLWQITLEQSAAGGWMPWNFPFPELPGKPGDPDDIVIEEAVERLVQWLIEHISPLTRFGVDVTHPSARPALERAHTAARLLRGAPDKAARLGEVHAALLPFQQWLASTARQSSPRGRVCPALFCIQRWFGAWLRSPTAGDDWQRLFILADLGVAMALGLIEDVLPYGLPGFDRINDEELRQWLMRHGAVEESAWSPPVKAVYDLAFAYAGGDATNPANARIAAGAAIKLIILMTLFYKYAPLWRLAAGMGETIFTPFYRVLEQRGVTFQFFHRVKRLDLSSDGAFVETIALDRQAEIIRPPYQPLFTVGGLECWPSEPKWDMLRDGDELRAKGIDFDSVWCPYHVGEVTLGRGRDFDLVVLGIPPAAAAPLAPGFNRDAAWRAMADQANSVATQAVQLWLSPTLENLGWSLGPTAMGSFAEPFDSWADMSHLLARESWPSGNRPQSIEYFCGSMPSPPAPAADDCRFITGQSQVVEANTKAWLAANIRYLWPQAAGEGGLKPGIVVSSYYHANIDPSELYVQSFPGTIKYRLDPAQPIFGNLYVAGDWTLSRINGGCVEAAIESGMRASHAICGYPRDIVG